MIRFPLETKTDPGLFETKVKEAINRTNSQHPKYIGGCQKSINGNGNSYNNSNAICLCKKHYDDDTIKQIFNNLESNCLVKIKTLKVRGRPHRDYFKYKSISWTFI